MDKLTWIQTYTGKQFFPLNPSPQQIDIEDIAHSLSLLCRFNGHCRQFYSVAEHSVRVSQLVSDELALWGLLHDSSEAYLSDMPKPVKIQIAQFSLYEEQLLKVIADRFNLSYPVPDEIKEADAIMLATERRDLMDEAPASWGLTHSPHPDPVRALSPPEAKQHFLERFRELTSSWENLR